MEKTFLEVWGALANAAYINPWIALQCLPQGLISIGMTRRIGKSEP